MVIHDQQQNRAIAGITAILSLWSAGEYGVVPVYRLPKKRKKKKK
jgi:hypothetical protein